MARMSLQIMMFKSGIDGDYKLQSDDDDD